MKKEGKMQPVQSVSRALDLLELVARNPEGVLLSEISNHLEVSQGAAFNLAGTLVQRGYLEKVRHPVRYCLGNRFLDMSQLHVGGRVNQVVGESMLELADKIPGLIIVFIVARTHNLFLQMRIDPTRPGLIQYPGRLLENPYAMVTSVCLLAFLDPEERSRVMQRYPVEEFADRRYAGRRAFLSVLDEIKESGIYSPQQESMRMAMAMPCYDHHSRLCGAMGVSVPPGSEPPTEFANAVSSALGAACLQLSSKSAL